MHTSVDPSSITIPDTKSHIPNAGRSLDEALIAARRAIGAVGKNGQYNQPGRNNNGAIRYAFRKHDDLVDAVGRAMADHGINIVPVDVIAPNYERIERLTKVTAMVKYQITATGTGESMTIVVMAEAADNSDKATNKLMTAAQKNMYLQVFHVAVTDADPDQERPDVVTPHAEQIASNVNETVNSDKDIETKLSTVRGAWKSSRSLKDVTISPALCLDVLGITEPIRLDDYLRAVATWLGQQPQQTMPSPDTW